MNLQKNMEEEIKNPELEKIINEANNKLSNKRWIIEAARIINNGGGTIIKNGMAEDFIYINETDRQVTFYGSRKEALSKEEVKPFFEKYKEGYTWNYTKAD
jgi:hypothetical protein